jgi:uncharacterized protein DUF6894
MPRYYFHISNGQERLDNPKGMDLPGNAAARQRAIDIRHARDADRAVEAAELRYERLHRVHDWTLYADFLELEVDGKKVDYCPPGVRDQRWN